MIILLNTTLKMNVNFAKSIYGTVTLAGCVFTCSHNDYTEFKCSVEMKIAVLKQNFPQIRIFY
jgi:hypothetical protein